MPVPIFGGGVNLIADSELFIYIVYCLSNVIVYEYCQWSLFNFSRIIVIYYSTNTSNLHLHINHWITESYRITLIPSRIVDVQFDHAEDDPNGNLLSYSVQFGLMTQSTHTNPHYFN